MDTKDTKENHESLTFVSLVSLVMSTTRDEPHREQHEVRVELNRRLRFDLSRVETGDVAVCRAGEAVCRDRVVSLTAFFVRQ